MSLNFETYALKGNEFISLVSQFLEIHDRNRSARIARCVLHALRDRLTVEESLHFIAQLPMALKGVYVDGWSVPSKHNHPKSLEDFLDLVLTEDGKTAWKDFSSAEEVLEAVVAVFKALSCYLTNGEMEKIITVLPPYLKAFVKECLTA